MQICLIFFPASIEAPTYQSVCISLQGEITAPLLSRSPEEIIPLQDKTPTYVVLPVERVSIYHLSLPKLTAKQAETAVLFALEPLLPQPLSQVHITYAYDKKLQSYTVIAVDKHYLAQVIQHLRVSGVHFNEILADADLLKPGEAFYDVSTSGTPRLVVYAKDYHGAIFSGFEPLYENVLSELTCYSQTDVPGFEKREHITDSIQLWLGQRVLENTPLNLSHGEFAVETKRSADKKYAWLAGAAVLCWILSYFISSGIILYRNHQQLTQLDTEIGTYFKQFFPQAREITNPRFRIEQLLKQSSGSSRAFWQLTTALAQHPIEIEQLRFQDQTLLVSFHVKRFNELQTIEGQLKKTGIHVKQVKANTSAHQVEATLELKL